MPVAVGVARSGGIGDGEPQLGDDEALAIALQDEYDHEHSDLRQQANRQQQQPLTDYRTNGYADPHASTMPSTVPVDLYSFMIYFYFFIWSLLLLLFVFIMITVIIKSFIMMQNRRRARCAKD